MATCPANTSRVRSVPSPTSSGWRRKHPDAGADEAGQHERAAHGEALGELDGADDQVVVGGPSSPVSSPKTANTMMTRAPGVGGCGIGRSNGSPTRSREHTTATGPLASATSTSRAWNSRAISSKTKMAPPNGVLTRCEPGAGDRSLQHAQVVIVEAEAAAGLDTDDGAHLHRRSLAAEQQPRRRASSPPANLAGTTRRGAKSPRRARPLRRAGCRCRRRAAPQHDQPGDYGGRRGEGEWDHPAEPARRRGPTRRVCGPVSGPHDAPPERPADEADDEPGHCGYRANRRDAGLRLVVGPSHRFNVAMIDRDIKRCLGPDDQGHPGRRRDPRRRHAGRTPATGSARSASRSRS